MVAAGQVGQPPTVDGQPVQFTLNTLGRLATPEQFENAIVRADRGGPVIRLKDVARVELGAKNEDVSNRFDRKQTIGLAVFLLSGENALETGDLVKAKIAVTTHEAETLKAYISAG